MQERFGGLAKSIYLAQLQAAKSGCDCEACKLLRKSTDEMTQFVLEEIEVKEKKEGV